ncbi:hypothetical protein ACQ4PT_000556 [Festuca glaucescens]
MATVGSSSRSGGKEAEGDESLARALWNLELREGELDDVIIGENDLEEMKKQARWLAVARVHTPKPFSSEALFQTLRFVWGLSRDPELREVDDNLFTFKKNCLGDWNKVMNQGPWLFRKLVLVIAEYDGIVQPTKVALDRVAVWAQIHSIPELYRRQGVVDQLAQRIGKVKSVEMSHQLWFEGDYVRVRASIEVAKPLIRFVPLNLAGTERKLLHVKYEKIGYFCDVCGIMGHDMEECGDGMHSEKEIQYGKWMIAKRRSQLPGQGFFRARGSGRFGGRGREGRGEYLGRKRPSNDAFEGDDDLDDTASSPEKKGEPTTMEEDVDSLSGKGSAARLLNFENVVAVPNPEEKGGLEKSGKVAEEVDLVPPPPPGYIPPREKKRSKKGQSTSTSSSVDSGVMATEAASEEDHLAQ